MALIVWLPLNNSVGIKDMMGHSVAEFSSAVPFPNNFTENKDGYKFIKNSIIVKDIQVPEEMTISLWIKPSANFTNHHIIDFRGRTPETGFQPMFYNSTQRFSIILFKLSCWWLYTWKTYRTTMESRYSSSEKKYRK